MVFYRKKKKKKNTILFKTRNDRSKGRVWNHYTEYIYGDVLPQTRG